MKHELTAALPAGDWPPPPPAPVTDPDILKGYLQDASRLVGHASALYRPRDELELAASLYHLNQAGTPVTVVARQTSTTGSSVPMGGAIVSMEKLARLLRVDPDTRAATAQGGILLGEFQREIEAAGWLYPPDPTSRNESTLGASVACNASGARTFKYGPTRPYIRRLRVVLAEGYLLEVARGQVFSDDRDRIRIHLPDGTARDVPCPTYPMPQVKHAAGYYSGRPLDLIDLFIGSEGTLGVISEVEVSILPRPEKVVSILAAWPDEDSALRFVQAARARRGSGGLEPRCLEWLDANALAIMAERYPEFALAKAGAAVFFEQECTGETEGPLLEQWYELLVETGALVEADNGVIVADTEAKQQLLYDLRHAVPAGVNERAARNGMPKLGTDLAVPDEALETMMHAYAAAVRDVPGTLGTTGCLAVLAEVLELTGDPGIDLSLPAAAVARLEAAADARVPASVDVPPRAAPPHHDTPASVPPPPGDALPSASAPQDGDPLATRILALWNRLELPHHFDYATFGHIGNNHVHVNLLPTTPTGLLVARRLYDHLTLEAIALGGTVSGEHGIGKIKRASLTKLLGPAAIDQMIAVKKVLDPRHILGRGNLFEATRLAS